MFPLGRILRGIRAAAGFVGFLAARRIFPGRSRATVGERFRDALEEMGTTFVKVGQALGLRQDLLRPEFIAALADLQDHVPAFGSDLARQEIERELGGPIDRWFSRFDVVPLAAASVAQVHTARLVDGREVVVKVRRPGVAKVVREDLRLLRWTAATLQAFLPPLRRLHPQEILDELSKNLLRELDFRQEAANIGRFAAAVAGSRTVFKHQADSGLVSGGVIVQERSGGLRVDDPSLREQGPQLARAFVDAYLHQFFVMGVFHGDPHPGNLFVMADGRICFHDFGLVGKLDLRTRRNLAAFMQAFVYRDGAWLLDTYLQMGVLAGRMSRTEFEEGLQALLDEYAALPLKEWSFATAFMRIARMGRGQNLRIPHDLLVLMRTFFLIETAVRALDPEYDLVSGLIGRARDVARQAARGDGSVDSLARLRWELGLLVEDLPALLLAIVLALRERAGRASQRK